MASAVVEERQLLKKLRWYDGFVISLATPGFLLGSLGYSVGDIGGWGSVLLWGISAALAFFIMTLYSEMAAMFPDKPGGFPLYAHEGWRKYFTLVGPIVAFGYWLAWSVVLAFLGVFSGQIITAAWFEGEPFGSAFFGSSEGEGYFSTGGAAIGLPHLIAIGLILAVWLFNIRGVRVAVGFGYLAGALLMIPLFVFMFLPFLNGDFSSSNLTWGQLDGTGGAGDETFSVSTWEVIRLSLVWLWIMAWSSWGVDTCATFAPEYKDTVNDTKLALRSACIFTIAVYTLLPLGLVGGVGEETVAAFDYVGALEVLTGSTALTNFFVIVIVASFVISMNTATADGSRALYGIARDDMTIKELFHLNRWHVPGRAMTLDMLVNIAFVLFVGNIFGILAASNIGYVLAHFFAITGFILLRKDRPDWPRPIKLSPIWVPIAWVLAAVTFVLIIFGVGWFQTAAGGYGGTTEKLIGLGVLVIAVLLFLYRRIVQDGVRPQMREEPNPVPDARQAALIAEAARPVV
ncbi:MAG: APC family permease [Actinobacteria bacterium]|nr:APC family permease [Actinomycetota bacterium]